MSFLQFIQDGVRYNRISDGKVVVDGFALNMDTSTINIPRYIKKGHMVVGISRLAFAENETIKHVSIPDTVCFIGERAFHKCTNLETFNMICFDSQYSYVLETDVPIKIDEKAFSGCKSLSKFHSIKQINLNGGAVFKNCSLLTKIEGKIHGDLPEKCFSNCFSLSEFCFSDKNMKIGIDSFIGCTNIKDFYIEKDLELNEEFLNAFTDSKFHCHPDSKYLSLAYCGYHIRKILPNV